MKKARTLSLSTGCPSGWGEGVYELTFLEVEESPSIPWVTKSQGDKSGNEKGVITKGVFSLEESLESLISLDSLESLENGRFLLHFPQSGGSLKSLESLNSLESLENGRF